MSEFEKEKARLLRTVNFGCVGCLTFIGLVIIGLIVTAAAIGTSAP